ncbi:MAG TPA: hypothetical protein VN133_14015 [Humibacter sp.]|nr:hypothetical protein [Humibacter sp.]
MKRILYASGSFLTDDAIADAIMDYASVLAIVESADVINCHGADQNGDVQQIQLLLGPASQILAMATQEPHIEMNAHETVADLRERARRRLPSSDDVGDPGTSRGAESDAKSTSHEPD